MLAVATVLAAGLTILPNSVHEAQANPCSVNGPASSGDSEDSSGTGAASSSVTQDSVEQNCEFIGPTDFNED